VAKSIFNLISNNICWKTLISFISMYKFFPGWWLPWTRSLWRGWNLSLNKEATFRCEEFFCFSRCRIPKLIWEIYTCQPAFQGNGYLKSKKDSSVAVLDSICITLCREKMWQKSCRVFISKELFPFMPQQFLKTRLCPDSPFSNLTPVVQGPLSLQLQILGNCS
jgi:hypothetical protein